jgi:SnoaL-like domain
MTVTGSEGESACTRLTRLFAFYVDRERYLELVELFTKDCTFERPGASVRGRPALLELMQKRPRTPITKHVCGTPLFFEMTAHDAAAVTEMTFYQGEPIEGSPPQYEAPAAIIEYHDRFRKTEDGWRIATRNVVVVMVKRR